MNILAVIPARGGSKGIKLKNLRKINGKTLVGLTIDCAKKVKEISNIVVSTDSELIKEEAISNGIEVPFLRPKSISGDRVADLPVLKHALIESEKYWKKKFHSILMLQPTSPLRNSKIVSKACLTLKNKNIQSVWSISQSDPKYHPLKQLIISEKDFLDYYDKNGFKIIARQQLSKLYHRNGAVYGFQRETILNLDKIMPKKTSYILCRNPQISIDNENDIELAHFYLNKHNNFSKV